MFALCNLLDDHVQVLPHILYILDDLLVVEQQSGGGGLRHLQVLNHIAIPRFALLNLLLQVCQVLVVALELLRKVFDVLVEMAVLFGEEIRHLGQGHGLILARILFNETGHCLLLSRLLFLLGWRLLFCCIWRSGGSWGALLSVRGPVGCRRVRLAFAAYERSYDSLVLLGVTS